jgi:GPH family glycoside/pentoside/hexuronide:cation symporter
MEKQERPLPLRRIWLYSAASAGLNIMSITVSTWVLYFYAPPPDSGRSGYLPAALVGVLLTVGSIWDAVIDPFIGHWSDTLRSRWGRRRPFLIFGAPLVALLLVLIWMPPQDAGTTLTGVYFMVVTVGYFTAFSLVGIPYDATMAEMAPDSHQRVRLSYWKNLLGLIGVLIGSVVAAPLFDSIGPVAMGGVVGLVGVVTVWLALLGLQEREKLPGKPLGAVAGMRMTLQNRQFIIVFIATLFVHLAYQMFLANLPYFVTLVLGQREGDVAIFQGVLIVVMGVAGLGWARWDETHSQRSLMLNAMVGMGLAAALVFFAGEVPGVPPLVQGVIAMLPYAVTLGGYFIISYALMGNVVDYDELLTGTRREAIYYGTFSFANGLGISVGSLILPLLLEGFGYTRANPLGVRVAFLVVGLSCLIGALIFRSYDLGDSIAETRRTLGLPEA